MRQLILLLLLGVLGLGCGRQPPPREFELTGQVLAVYADRQEIVIRHQDIKGFMPGMTMPFRVKDSRLLDAARPGDVVTATLVVGHGDAWLSRVTSTGRHEPVPADAMPAHITHAPLEAGEVVPDATLVDQDGRPFQVRALRGVPWVVTFVYTRCPLPTFCPAVDRRFQTLQSRIRQDPALSRARLVSVSIDPEFDRPEVLRAHAARLGADPDVWQLVTGDRDAIDRFGQRFGLSVDRGAGGPEDLMHSLRTAVVDPQQRLVRVYRGADWDVDAVLADVRGAGR